MSKKYRFKNDVSISTSAGTDYYTLARTMIKTKEVFYGDESSVPGNIRMIETRNGIIYEFKKDWLEEVNDEPMAFDEWFDKNWNYAQLETWRGFFRRLYKWTIENERLKHEPKQSFDEWYHVVGCTFPWKDRERIKEIWEECEKNRGYNE